MGCVSLVGATIKSHIGWGRRAEQLAIPPMFSEVTGWDLSAKNHGTKIAPIVRTVPTSSRY